MSSGNEILSKCLSECLIYKASVNRTINKYYFERTIKEHFNNHRCSFRNLVIKRLNCLSMYGNWKRDRERKREINYFINWDISMKLPTDVCGSRKCDLCICDKVLIAGAYPKVLLKKRR